MNNVLVIDDEKMIADMLRKALTIYGYNVETASEGKEGLRMFEAESFDLVITDIRMPDIDGIEVARCIRSSDKPHTPIIAMSGTPWLMNGNGFDFTIPKPFSIQTLMDAVKELTLIPVNPASGLLNNAPVKMQ
ncbi:MAG: response regulator [Deltaproteobacteria bacterium]|nr:response regulator [Deltaproteobacteria bacterium]MBW2117536.1 response regulator [Deltaproteobacteria bacterium]MBW2345064.1 response regulator [Deltaproteobacteria bacterium]